MPKINISRTEGRARGLRLPREQAIPEDTSDIQALNRLGLTLSQIGIDVLNKRRAAVDSAYVADAHVNTTEELTRLRQEMLTSRENPQGFAEDFMKEADKVYKSSIDNAPSDSSRRSLQSGFASSRVGLFKSAFSQETKLIADTALSSAETNINLIANRVAENPDSLGPSLEELDLLSESVGNVLDPSNKEKFSINSQRLVLGSYVQGLIDSNRLEEADKIIDNDRIKEVFSPEERDVLKRSVNAQEKSNAVKIKQGREIQVDDISQDFLVKEKNNKLTIKEVLSSELDAVGTQSKDFWIKRIEKSEISFIGNAKLYNETYSDIDELTQEEIWELADPSNLTGGDRPLNMKQVESLLKAQRKDTDKVLKRYFKGIKASITGDMVFTSDPEGDRRFAALKFEAEQMVENSNKKGTKEFGLTARDMFNPNSSRYSDFGGLLLKDNINKDIELMDQQAQRKTKQEKKGPKKPIEERFKELTKKKLEEEAK